MNYFISKSLSWKYQRIKPSGCKDEGIRKFEFVTKTQCLYNLEYIHRIYKKFNLKNQFIFKEIIVPQNPEMDGFNIPRKINIYA